MTSTSKTPTIALASTFARLLAEALGTKTMREVVRRNAARNDTTCASHDFCDANEVMAEAFSKTVGREIDLESDADTSLWNAAWDIAVATKFAIGETEMVGAAR